MIAGRYGSPCTASCWAEADYIVCKRRKAPRGRSVPAEAAGSYCPHECPGHNQPPIPGHYWPGEARDDTEAP